ncbi:ZIP family transporter [Stieleria varia]|uniref:Zinc transporter ZupT n=1 Tax=Stieleria varia TaxID=2528005 RepID=A0A5C5ZQK6_9BACT|nr:ZIP family metal transporter [Stieleria varia]TWT89345.1 zinc transporter ZupT [Stieleria varia]
MPIEVLLCLYCVFVITASVAGGRLPTLIRMTHLRTQIMMSFVGGLMLGIALLHLLPHAAHWLPSPHKIGIGTLTGVLVMFLLQRAFHHHHHDIPHEDVAVGEGNDPHDHADAHSGHHDHVGHEHADHEHVGHEHADHEHVGHEHAAHGIACEHEHHQQRTFGWVGMVFGLGLHTMIDGVAMAASAMAEYGHGAWMGLAGLGTFLAVALHKPLDAFAITTMMRAEGWPEGRRSAINVAFSLAAPTGAILFYFFASAMPREFALIGWGLAISAGFFLCIALADLLPELSFHDHDRGKLTLALLVGIALAIAVENLPGHTHAAHTQIPAGGEVQELPMESNTAKESIESKQ